MSIRVKIKVRFTARVRLRDIEGHILNQYFLKWDFCFLFIIFKLPSYVWFNIFNFKIWKGPSLKHINKQKAFQSFIHKNAVLLTENIKRSSF